ncbi:hypothetical protein BV899_05780 [Alcaligenes phenolicus]|nr:hypothetical protein BV899_05780 [Alcaligenes phenolicus]
MKETSLVAEREAEVLPLDSVPAVAPVAAAQNPGRGGSYVRNKQTGGLKRVQYTETCKDCVLTPIQKG